MVDAEGRIWTGVDDGRIVRISPESGEATVVGDTGGRPLGLARCPRRPAADLRQPTRACSRWIPRPADSRRWSTRSTTESCGSARMSPKQQTAQSISQSRRARSPMPTTLAAILEARGRGSLFRRDPDGTVLTLVPGLYFANGLTLTADGSALVFAETAGPTTVEVLADGAERGIGQPLSANLPGMPDNLSTGADGRIWCALVTPANPTHRSAGETRAAGAQTALAAAVAAAAQAGIGRLGRRVRPRHRECGRGPADRASGVRSSHRLVEADGKLWMGSIGGPAVAWADLSDARAASPLEITFVTPTTRVTAWLPGIRACGSPNLRSQWRPSRPRPGALPPWQRRFS